MSYNKSQAFAGIGSVLSRGDATALAPPPAPVLEQVTGGSLLARTYYVRITLTNATGETLASMESSLAIEANKLCKVKSPAAVGDAVSWDAYISETSGAETKETATTVTIGTDYTEAATGLAGGGAAMPTTNASGTFTELAEVKTLTRSGSKSDLVDVTNMQSTGGFREWLPTLRDAGEFDFTANRVSADATQEQLDSDFNKATQSAWQLTWPAGSITGSAHTNPAVFSFNGYVVQNDESSGVDKAVEISGKLKITGQPTLTPES